MPNSPVPTVEMLWEDLDPRLTLAERFGFADATAAGCWVVDSVRRCWLIEDVTCERIVLSASNALAWLATPDGGLLAKWSIAPDRFQRLEQVANLTLWLGAQGLPVSAPLPSRHGRVQVELDGSSMGVQRAMPGDLLDTNNLAQVRAAGATLARLHLALAEYRAVTSLFEDDTGPEALSARVTTWLDAAGGQVPSSGLTTLHRMVADAPQEPAAAQVVHGDFRASNILCTGPDVVAVLDLEETRLDFPIDEIARSAVLLGTRFRDWGPVSAGVRATFLAGYEAVRPLSPAERAWWVPLVLWYSLQLVPEGDDPTGWRAAAYEQIPAL